MDDTHRLDDVDPIRVMTVLYQSISPSGSTKQKKKLWVMYCSLYHYRRYVNWSSVSPEIVEYAFLRVLWHDSNWPTPQEIQVPAIKYCGRIQDGQIRSHCTWRCYSGFFMTKRDQCCCIIFIMTRDSFKSSSSTHCINWSWSGSLMFLTPPDMKILWKSCWAEEAFDEISCSQTCIPFWMQQLWWKKCPSLQYQLTTVQ